MSKDVKTPMLDDLEKGAWPSFVKEIKKAAKKSNTAQDLLGILERSYRDKVTHWKHGGIVGVLGYGGGVIGRYCDLPEEFPGRGALPHRPRQSAVRILLHLQGPERAVRYLGQVRQRPDEHARFNGRHDLARHPDRQARAHLRRDHGKGLGPRRLRFLPPHPELLRGHGPLRVLEHRHHEHLPYPHPEVPG